MTDYKLDEETGILKPEKQEIYFEDYLYDKELEELSNKFNEKKIHISKITEIEDLFQNGIQSPHDVMVLLIQLKTLGIKSLKYFYYDKYYHIPLRTIYGLAQGEYEACENTGGVFHNSNYPLAAFYQSLVSSLNYNLSYESDFEDANLDRYL